MTEPEAIAARHSVRKYLHKPVPDEIRSQVQAHLDRINAESGLHFQAVWDAPEIFDGKIQGAENCLCFIGRRSPDFSEKVGYYGADIMLRIQELGMNSVWCAMSFNRKPAAARVDLADGEQILNVLAFGYGETQGHDHKSKPVEKLMSVKGTAPDWFKAGMDAALLAPTAMNQQKFVITYEDGRLGAKAKIGPYAKVDLGIVKYFFEAGSGHGF